MLKRGCLAAVLVALVLVVWVCPAAAQTSFGRISGAVVDQTGAAVPSAKVTIRDVDTQATRVVATDAPDSMSPKICRSDLTPWKWT